MQNPEVIADIVIILFTILAFLICVDLPRNRN